jgi:hypothetical protein
MIRLANLTPLVVEAEEDFDAGMGEGGGKDFSVAAREGAGKDFSDHASEYIDDMEEDFGAD